MKVGAVPTWDLEKAGNDARELEEMGYAGLKIIETAHDPSLRLTRQFARVFDMSRLALEVAARIQLQFAMKDVAKHLAC